MWLERFLTFRRDQGLSTWPTAGSLRLVLGYLRSVGLVPAEVAHEPVTPAEMFVAEYTQYLATERELVQTTIEQRRKNAMLFIAEVGQGSDGICHQLDGQQVVEFVQAHVGDHGVGTAKVMISGLRCFLQFLYLTGRTQHALADIVPGVADSRRRQLPKHVDPGIVEQLIESCSTVSVVGVRDRAILLVMAKLGLRRGELAGLRLDDLDWRAGQMSIPKTKSRRHDIMPLPVDVGKAIAEYLHERLPATTDRRVFLRVTAPHTGMDSGGIPLVVQRACQRANVEMLTPHQLRHTLAAQMLNTGANIADVSQVWACQVDCVIVLVS